LLIPLAHGDLIIPLLAAAWLGFGFCAVVYNVTGISLVQASTPDRMLGRMTASRRFIVFGIGPIGLLTGGALGTSLGLRETIWIGAIGASLAFLPLLASPIPRIKNIADAEALTMKDPLLADPPLTPPTPGTDAP
jgi:MFS family permease